MYIVNGFYVDVIKENKNKCHDADIHRQLKHLSFLLLPLMSMSILYINYSLVQRITETLPNVVVRER